MQKEKSVFPLLLPPPAPPAALPAAAVVGGAKPTTGAAAAAAAAAVAAALGCSTKNSRIREAQIIEIELRYPQQLRIKEEETKSNNKQTKA